MDKNNVLDEVLIINLYKRNFWNFLQTNIQNIVLLLENFRKNISDRTRLIVKKDLLNFLTVTGRKVTYNFKFV